MTTLTTLTHSRCPYQSRSVLMHETQSHGDHIYIYIYVDVLHEGQVTVRVDWGYTFAFPDVYAKSHIHPCAFDVHFDQLHSYDAYPHTTHRPLV
jgi:hypothetical protein